MPQRVRFDIAFANFGRKYDEEVELRRAMRAFFLEFPLASKGLAEIDEADPADEHDIVQDLKHRLLKEHFLDYADDLDPGNYSRKIKRLDLDAAHNRVIAGFSDAAPIVTSPVLDLVGIGLDQTVKGKAHVSPHRVATTALYNVSQFGPKMPLAHHNGHFPYRWPEGWKVCRESWVGIVARYHRLGIPQFITLDSNKHDSVINLHARQQVIAKNGIDVILFVPGNDDAVRVRSMDPERTVFLGVDGHRGVGRRMMLLAP